MEWKICAFSVFWKVLLRDLPDDDVIPIVEELQRRLPPVNAVCEGQVEDEENHGAKDDVESGEREFPFEFRVLEVALEGICSFLDVRMRELETAAYPVLDELTSRISSRNLDRVRKLKCAMTRLTSWVQKVRDELEQLLDDDDDMAGLYLSRKLFKASSPDSGSSIPDWVPPSPTIGSNSKISRISGASGASLTTINGHNDVEELEMLLEIEGTLTKLTTLDNHPNQLIQLELFLSSGTVCLSIYSLVAAIFGMNITYTWKEGHGYVFKWDFSVECGSIFLSINAWHKGLVGSRYICNYFFEHRQVPLKIFPEST